MARGGASMRCALGLGVEAGELGEGCDPRAQGSGVRRRICATERVTFFSGFLPDRGPHNLGGPVRPATLAALMDRPGRRPPRRPQETLGRPIHRDKMQVNPSSISSIPV
jgi:hypothetical protein